MDTPASQPVVADEAKPAPRWQPLQAIDRRVLGVLVEKAKTTPDGYPMTLNALVTGCNQKSNRYPTMNVEPEDVEESLDRLRSLGAAAVIQGGSRVDKYRHFIYEWLGVGKAEAAVMAELLLRGAQTEGELRGRAARMEPIADLTALRPILESLKLKKLVVGLSPEGRGHVVMHPLLEPREMEKVRAQFAAGAPALHDADDEPADSPRRTLQGEAVLQAPPAPSTPANKPQTAPPQRVIEPLPSSPSGDKQELRAALEDLKNMVLQLRGELADLSAEVSSSRQEIQRLRDALGG